MTFDRQDIHHGFQICKVWSTLAEAIYLPLGDQATAVT